ncbi:hypothetical protein L218DRAFT_700435 [Marasmius fiardii PR-910]|nr:hypothetical protein L218DRAFT_700435 [Marasmius fiardii PR-910]
MVCLPHQDELSGLYKDWAPPVDSKYRPKSKQDAWLNIRMHQYLAQSYTRAREYQKLCGLDDDEDEDEDEDDPDFPGFNESQKEVERYLEFINALPPRPQRLNSQSEPSSASLDDGVAFPQFLASTPSTPTRPRWRRYLSLESAKAPFLSPVKLWKRTTSLPTPLSQIPFPLKLPLHRVSVSLKSRAPFAAFRRTKSAPAKPVALTKQVMVELHRASSVPGMNQASREEQKRLDGTKKKRRMTVDDGQTVIARTRLQNFGAASTSATLDDPTSSLLKPVSPIPPHLNATRRKRDLRRRRRSSGGEGYQRVQSPLRPSLLRLSFSAPSPIAEVNVPQIPSSPYETTATCPYSIRQRPMPPDEWFGFSAVRAGAKVTKLPVNEERRDEENSIVYELLYLIFLPILGLSMVGFVYLLAVPVCCVWTPVDYVLGLFMVAGVAEESVSVGSGSECLAIDLD